MTRRLALNNRAAHLEQLIKQTEAEIRTLTNRLVKYRSDLRKYTSMKDKKP